MILIFESCQIRVGAAVSFYSKFVSLALQRVWLLLNFFHVVSFLTQKR